MYKQGKTIFILLLWLSILQTPVAFSKNWQLPDMQGIMYQYNPKTHKNSYMAMFAISKKGLQWMLVGNSQSAIQTLRINRDKNECYLINVRKKTQTTVKFDKHTGYCLLGDNKQYYNPLGTLLDNIPCNGFSIFDKLKTENYKHQHAEVWQCKTKTGIKLTQWFLPEKSLVIKIKASNDEIRLIKELNAVKLKDPSMFMPNEFSMVSYDEFMRLTTE